jgi:predicted hydrocarbon binding protein
VSDDALILGYRSARRLCALAEGFIEAAAEHYGERAVVEQTTCMQRGDARCAFKIALTRSPG